MWGYPDLKEITIMLTMVPTVPDQGNLWCEVGSIAER
jgi:hypothetical protein